MQNDSQIPTPSAGGMPPIPPVEPPAPITPAPTPITPLTPAAPVNPFFSAAPSPVSPTPPTGLPPVDAPVTPAPSDIPPAPKSKKKLIIILAIVLVALLAAAAAAYFLFIAPPSGGSDNSKNAVSLDTDSSDKQTITATSVAAYTDVCNGKKVSNAVDSKKPYSLVGFTELSDKIWSTYGYLIPDHIKDFTYDLAVTNVVVCMTPDASTAQAGMSCTVSDPTKNNAQTTITYKNVTYDVSFVNPKSGEVLFSDKLVTNEKCPKYGNQTGEQYIFPTDQLLSPIVTKFFAA